MSQIKFNVWSALRCHVGPHHKALLNKRSPHNDTYPK